jgi:hypothetical protein
MKNFCFAVAFGALAIPLCCQAATFDVRTGSWEMTTTTTMAGMMMPKEVLDSMPPDRRAKVEAAMKARSGKAITNKTVECITQEDLDRSELLKSDDDNCKTRVISQSAHHLEGAETCPPPRATNSHFVFDAQSATSYSASIDVTRAEGGSVHVAMNGRWLAASCPKGSD